MSEWLGSPPEKSMFLRGKQKRPHALDRHTPATSTTKAVPSWMPASPRVCMGFSRVRMPPSSLNSCSCCGAASSLKSAMTNLLRSLTHSVLLSATRIISAVS